MADIIKNATLQNYTAMGVLVGKLIKDANGDVFLDVPNKGIYPARFTRDMQEYIESSNISLIGDHTFVVSPETKPRGYERPVLGQVAHKPYMSFIILDIDPKKPVGVVGEFKIKATCIRQHEPDPTKNEAWYPYALMVLSSYSSYNTNKENKNKRILKVCGILPREKGSDKRDAVGSKFEITAVLGEGKDKDRLFIANNKVRRLEEVAVVNKPQQRKIAA